MNTLRYLSIAMIASLALLTWSCGDDNSESVTPPPTPTPTPTGKHLTMTHETDGHRGYEKVVLTGLTSEITSISGDTSWLTATALPYESSTPELKVSVEENTGTGPRQQDITIIAERDTMVLTVVQQFFDPNGGDDLQYTFLTPSDEPACVRK